MSDEYPPDWSTPELGDFAKATGGSRFPPSAQGSNEGDYPFYKVSDMNLAGNERFMGVANHWITEATRKEIKAKTFPAGSVIFPKIGAAVATNKKRLLTQESIIDNNVMAIVVNNPQLCAFNYLRFWFETIDLQDLSNSGTLPSIPGHRVHTIRVPLPPLAEQKKIAHILSTVQRAIEAQERIIQTTTELKKALMHKLFTEGLRNEPQKQTEIGPVPESWEVVGLGTLFEKRPQNGIYKHKREYGSGTQILRIDDFSNDGDVVRIAENRVELARSEIETYGLEPGDIVINRVNSLSHLGKTALIGAIGDEMVFESNMMRFSVGESQIQKKYVFKFLNSPLTKKQIIRTAKRAVAQSSINQGDVKSIIVLKPSLEEQEEIVAALDATEAKIAHATDKASVLRDLFRTLLHELMSAKTRVHTLSIPTSS